MKTLDELNIAGSLIENTFYEHRQMMWYVEEDNANCPNPDERMFWAFVFQRQAAWARRACELPKPWTGDAVIADWRFTNIYRELDRGTLFAAEILEQVWERHHAFMVIPLYRLFNRIDTWQNMMAYCGHDNAGEFAYDLQGQDTRDKVYEFFHDQQAKGVTLFTGAYMCTSAAKIMHERLIEDIFDISFKAANTKMGSHVNGTMNTMKLFAGAQYLGEFSAFQIAMDLAIPVRANGNQPWQHNANLNGDIAIGPGSKAGAKIIRPDMPALTLVKYLSENAIERIFDLESKTSTLFNYPLVHENKLTLRTTDIEHALCEYAKYRRAIDGGRMKSKMSTPAVDSWRPKTIYPKGWIKQSE